MLDYNSYCFIFDIDGTLTQPTQPMSEDIARTFYEWSLDKKVYLATGSDWEGVKRQVKPCLLKSVSGVFTCSGSQYFSKEMENEYMRMEWNPPADLIHFFEEKLMHSDYPDRWGKHLVPRIGMFNFSIPGRASNLEQRLQYFNWDATSGERVKIQREAQERFPDLEFHVGGQISIDCYPTGWNKSRVIKYLREWHPESKMVYFGDKLIPGGNDYPIVAQLAPSDSFYKVSGPEHTLEIIKELFSA